MNSELEIEETVRTYLVKYVPKEGTSIFIGYYQGDLGYIALTLSRDFGPDTRFSFVPVTIQKPQGSCPSHDVKVKVMLDGENVTSSFKEAIALRKIGQVEVDEDLDSQGYMTIRKYLNPKERAERDLENFIHSLPEDRAEELIRLLKERYKNE